jgi:methionyl-tRNA formyltransferase
MHPNALLELAAELLREVMKFDAAADGVVSAFFRRQRSLGPRERHALAETTYAVLRRRLLNVHPSLLPAFTGLDTHRRAIEAGCKLAGATVHFVTPALDHGPIIAQAVVPVLAGDDAAALAARVLAREHVLYPRALRWLVEDALRVERGIVTQTRGESQLLL